MIVLFPFEDNFIYKYNQELDCWDKLPILFIINGERRDKSCSLFWKYAMVNNKIFMFPEASDYIYIINNEFQLEKKIAIEYDDKRGNFIRRNQIRHSIKNGIALREEEMSLEEYLINIDKNIVDSKR